LYVDELLLPHLAYKPFLYLTQLSGISKISFLQESLQCPQEMLCVREALLLSDPTNSTTFFTTEIPSLNSKLTKIFYGFSTEILPLHLKHSVIGNISQSIRQYIPHTEKYSHDYDYAIIAGKALNCEAGHILLYNIICQLRMWQPDSRILFKASPSSTDSIINFVKTKHPSVDIILGNTSIENLIVDGKIQTMITELFSLATLSMICSPKTKIISIENTIMKDYPSLAAALSDRIYIPQYKKALNGYSSLSEYIFSYLIKNS
tara:strand:- start:79 stop:864 length:786 start_codon:yes stop_codon:yes gene_type:complete